MATDPEAIFSMKKGDKGCCSPQSPIAASLILQAVAINQGLEAYRFKLSSHVREVSLFHPPFSTVNR